MNLGAVRSAPLVTRRRLQIALGALWLFDGILQSQPSSFQPEFFGMMLRMGQAEPPGWLWDLGSRVEPVVTTHAAAANALFVGVQLVVALGLFVRRTVKPALALSVAWALAVWLFGEAAGGLFGPNPNALTGAPGAALVYAVVAVVLWPRRADDGDAVSDGGVPRPLPELAWIGMWVGTAVLEAKTLNDMSLISGSAIYSVGIGEPAWIAFLNHGLGDFVGAHGVLFAVLAGVAQAAVGIGVISPRTRRGALAAGIALAAFYGVVGQDLGGIFSNGFNIFGSGATDPGTGPILVLFALALWPRRAPVRAVAPAEGPEAAVVIATDGAVVADAVVPARARRRPRHRLAHNPS